MSWSAGIVALCLGVALASVALLLRLNGRLGEALQAHRLQLDERRRAADQGVLEGLHSGLSALQITLNDSLERSSRQLSERVDALTRETHGQLERIAERVDQRLDSGFEKTTRTFQSVLQHLVRIDEAQRRIQELSTNILELQDILDNKQALGAFGEVQLEAIVRRALPDSVISFQPTLSNGRRPDCVLHLPPPTGAMCIDSKFPLEDFRRQRDPQLDPSEREQAKRRFPRTVLAHARDIHERYVAAEETWSGALMFVPSETVFAEIHAQHRGVVEGCQELRVYLCSPSTLMAVCTTAAAVIKDQATREQVDVIQAELVKLSEDFTRFERRMEALAKHIGQANEDVGQIQVSARKLVKRFSRIERVEIAPSAESDGAGAGASLDVKGRST